MVALFASLKLRLIRNRRRAAGPLGQVGWFVGTAFAVAIGGLIGLGLTMLRPHPTAAPLVLANVFVTLWLAWMVMPMIAFGVDETVDPRRFALIPLRHSTLQRGLLVSALIGYLPVANLLILLGGAVALTRRWSMLPVTILCALALLLMCVIYSRALAASMAALMGSRRGRDLGMFVSFVLFALYFVASALLSGNRAESFASSVGGTVGRVLGYTPPGALAFLPEDLYAARWLTAAARLVIVVAAFAIGWLWWGRALTTTLTTIGSMTEASAAAAGLIDSSVVATSVRSAARLSLGRAATMAWRDPMRRLPWLMVIALAVLWPFMASRGRMSSYACLFGAVMCGAQAAGAYAVEGSGLWLHLVAFADRWRARGELWGYALVALIPGGVITVIAVLIQTIVRNSWSEFPPALGVCLAGLLGATAASVTLAAYLPYAFPQSRTSMFASRVPGQGGRAAAATIGVILGGLILALPAVVLAVLAHLVDPVFGWLGLVLGPAIAALGLLAGVRAASDRYLRTAPEVLQVVSAGDRF